MKPESETGTFMTKPSTEEHTMLRDEPNKHCPRIRCRMKEKSDRMHGLWTILETSVGTVVTQEYSKRPKPLKRNE
eukprot:3142348-Amphidinium_carterae.1